MTASSSMLYSDSNTGIDPMSTNLSQEKNVRQMSGKSSTRFSKSDYRFWEKKIFNHSRKDGDSRINSNNYSVKLSFRKERHNLALGVSNQREAAKLAASIYKILIADGWGPVLAKYRPAEVEPEPVKADVLTVGKWIESTRAVSRVGVRTFEDYSRSLRLITSSIAGIPEDKKKFDGTGGGGVEWRSTVEALPLEIITKASVEMWMTDYVKKAGSDPVSVRHRQNGCNSVLRMAKALFSQDLIGRTQSTIEVPHPIPFSGVKPFQAGAKTTRYKSKIDAEKILADASKELAADPKRIEEWKALLIALCCGLRKSEIDCLTWNQINFERATISIERTKDFAPKSTDSEDDVDVEPEIIEILRDLKIKAKGNFYLESPLAPRPNSKHVYYRAEKTWKLLNAWLRSKGVPPAKPIHEMRKELGALLATNLGIYAAQRVLRHSQIGTTAAYYTDKKTPITGKLGKSLSLKNDI